MTEDTIMSSKMSKDGQFLGTMIDVSTWQQCALCVGDG